MIKARCLVCGHLFPSSIKVENSFMFQLSNIQELCPKCGNVAMVSDGLFSSTPKGLQIHSAPKWSRDMYDQLSDVARKAKDDDLSVKQILAEVAEVSPQLAATLKKRGLTATIMVLLLIWLLKNISLDVSIDVNRLIDQGISAVGGVGCTSRSRSTWTSSDADHYRASGCSVGR